YLLRYHDFHCVSSYWNDGLDTQHSLPWAPWQRGAEDYQIYMPRILSKNLLHIDTKAWPTIST
ncbi:hypothetical protein CHS0354_042962, partial [Potamilus streckersoni]